MAMSLTERRERAAARKAQAERLAAIERDNAAFAAHVNAAIAGGTVITIDTAFGVYVLDSITAQLQGHTHPVGRERSWTNQREFMLSGASLAAIRAQAGV